MSKFGRIITGADVEAAAREHIRRWSPDYLAEVGDQNGRGRIALPGFRSYVPAVDLDRFAEDQVPACVIVAPGTLREPEKRRGAWYMTWTLSVGCVVSGRDRDSTFALLPLYAAAVRALMVQRPAMGVDFVDGVSLLGERYDELDTDDARTLAAGSVTFGIDVPSAVDSRGGITEPSVTPATAPGDWGLVDTVGITTTEKGTP